jgi:hypothetical protein
MSPATALTDQHPRAPQQLEYWALRNGEWRFIVEPLTALELARASSLMAARFGPNARRIHLGRRGT